jgi:RNA recognition motif-containing protein
MSTLFIGGLAWEADENLLRETFEAYGPVVDVKLLRFDDGRSKGVGFVRFRDEADATRALEKDGTELLERVLRVQVAKDRRADRRPRPDDSVQVVHVRRRR